MVTGCYGRDVNMIPDEGSGDKGGGNRRFIKCQQPVILLSIMLWHSSSKPPTARSTLITTNHFRRGWYTHHRFSGIITLQHKMNQTNPPTKRFLYPQDPISTRTIGLIPCTMWFSWQFRCGPLVQILKFQFVLLSIITPHSRQLSSYRLYSSDLY